MAVKLEDMKKYLRVDFSDDDMLIEKLIEDAEKRCKDIARKDVADTSSISNFDLGVMYCVAYTYEHREDCDYPKLNLALRGLLFGDREARF